jgi:hypothetical protein
MSKSIKNQFLPVAGLLFSFAATLVASPAQAEPAGLNITIVGTLPDLDFDGSNADENALLHAAADIWSQHIQTPRDFVIDVSTQDFVSSALARGAVVTMDGFEIPLSGTIAIDPDLSNNFSANLDFIWFVDDTPYAAEEFTPSSDYDEVHRHYEDGPGSDKLATERHIDLLTIVMHEMGHALGWFAPTRNQNPRFYGAFSPQPEDFVEGDDVYLVAGDYFVPMAGTYSTGELSHAASRGFVPGYKESLMSAVFLFIDRFMPGDRDIEMFEAVFGDDVSLHTISGPSGELLDGPAFMSFEDPARPWVTSFGGGQVLPTSDADSTSGDKSLSLSCGYKTFESGVFNSADFELVGNRLILDVRIPNDQVNPYWIGGLELHFDAPSSGFYNSWLQRRDLNALSLGQFSSVTFDLPQSVVKSLLANTKDARFRISSNIGSCNSPVLIDSLRFAGTLTERN